MKKGLTKLGEYTQRIICNKFISGVTGTIRDRTKRKHDKVGEQIFRKLKRKEKLPEDSPLILGLDYSTNSVSYARNISMAIEEFKAKFPKYGKELQDLIDSHRSKRRSYLKFGLREGEKLSEEIYLNVIKENIEGITD